MKVKRHKKIRKYTEFYQITYGIRPPYKILLDGDYLQAALEGKIRIVEQLPKLLQQKATPMVTKCVVHDLQQKGKHYRGAAMIGSNLKHARCAHEGIVEPHECLKLLTADGNKEQWFVGAQDVELRKFMRNTPGIPVLFIHGQVPIMEPPSASTQKQATEKREERTALTDSEKKVLKKIAPKPAATTTKKKKKGPKQPNPLSVKKKKKKPSPNPDAEPNSKESKGTGDSAKQDATDSSISTPTESTGTSKRKRKRTRKRKGGAENEDTSAADGQETQSEKSVDAKKAKTNE